MTPDEQVLTSIRRQPFDERTGTYRCGCHELNGRWRLCGYHCGYQDALDETEALVADTLTCLDAAQESAWGICLETEQYRFGKPGYDLTWDHVWELANNVVNCSTNARAAAVRVDSETPHGSEK